MKSKLNPTSCPWTLLLLLLLVFAAGNTSPQCTPVTDEQGGSCIASTQCSALPHGSCAGEWTCEDGGCLWVCDEDPEVFCASDEDCDPTQLCSVSQGECLAPPGCGGDVLCPAVCFGHCQPRPVETFDCRADEDCDSGEVCDITDCIAPDCADGEPCVATCMPVGRCIPDESTSCSDNDSCAAGTHCSVFDGVCQTDPGCDEGMPCDALCFGTCVANEQPPVSECVQDSDCADRGEHWICNLLDCWSPPCYPGEPCVDMCMAIGECVEAIQPPPVNCTGDFDCQEGEVCLEQVTCPPCLEADPPCAAPCVLEMLCVQAPQPSECSSDLDCGEGMVCEMNTICEGDPQANCAPDENCMSCTQVGTCIQKPAPGCIQDADCPEGERCELVDGCADTDPNNCWDGWCMDCSPYGVCVPAADCSLVDCAPGFELDLTTCECVSSQNPCIISGCSGQICAAESMVSDCMWQDYYVCFSPGITSCGPFGPGGSCMWEPTIALYECTSQFFPRD